jgi:hypothetical protein
MSSEEIAKLVNVVKPDGNFEKHILHCCRAPEYELRKWLKKTLGRAGFRFIEDNYKTERANKDKRYDNIHNLVAIRGENPDVCLVAHTDVCREHSEKTSSRPSNEGYEEFQKWLGDGKKVSKEEYQLIKDEIIKEDKPYRVDPVVKTVMHNGKQRRIIQDRLCKIQVGGDDRLGVAINTWIALNTGFDMGLYFPTDEEIGLKSARACDIPELKEFEILVQVDRGNKSNELVTKINNEILCTYEVGTRLIDIAYKMGKMRAPVTGMHTDVYAIKSRNMCKNAVNMTCGYHDSFGAGANEYIEINEARDTMHYVHEIVKDYYLFGR